jgi:hypothetical protein
VFHEDGPEESPKRPGDSEPDLSPLIPRAIEDYFRANGQREIEGLPPSADEPSPTEPEEHPGWRKWTDFDPAALAAKPELDCRDGRDLLGL